MSDTLTLSLSGVWQIFCDEDRRGLEKGWQKAMPAHGAHDITVPGMLPQSTYYGSHSFARVYPGHHGYVWYYRTFSVPFAPDGNRRCLIEFDNAGYLCRVYLNGQFLGEHRQHEEQFSFDITDVLNYAGENLLAVQCLEPKIHGEPIEGIALDTIPNASQAYGDYDNEPTGGIMEDVRIKQVADPRIDSLYIRPDYETGEVAIEVEIVNCKDAPVPLTISSNLFEHKGGNVAACVSREVEAAPGRSVHTLTARIEGRRVWDIDTPFLYAAQVETCSGSRMMKRFGFKDFRVKHGFFFLNGRRIFLKSAHCTPTCETALGMKVMGFNTIRMLTRRADQELMDICDEIGLLMIDSAMTAWGMFDHENTRRFIFDYNDAMVRRDRSHACLAGYYIFNELMGADGVTRIEHGHASIEAFRAGVDYLKRMRELDSDHVALLSSGRWDFDLTIGSYANPGVSEWEYGWGHEAPDATGTGMTGVNYDTFATGPLMGDMHPYITFPAVAATRRWYRSIGHDCGPVFISEEGFGSQSDPVRRYLELQAAGKSLDSIYSRQYKRLWDGLEGFIRDNGFEGIYPFAQDFVTEGYYLNARQRQQMFDLIRSNPKINGYSLTSWCDANEGTIEGENVLKPGQAYALQEGWAPLRWALFTSEKTVYAGKPFEVEAVLCNEDRLAPGSYRALARIRGEQGIVWEKAFDACYPADGYGDMPPLAATVLKETVTLPAGEYTFAVRLLEGAPPFGGNLKFKVAEPALERKPAAPVAVCALDKRTISFLHRWGIATVDAAQATAPALVLVGALDRDAAEWDMLDALARSGSTVVLLRTEPFDGDRTTPVPRFTGIAGEMARCTYFRNWLYHMDNVHKAHPLFAGISEKSGILDIETMGDVYPRQLLLDVDQPDAVYCASIGLNCFIENNCARSQTLCEYTRGAGRYVINAFRIEEALGEHPFADQLLLNMVSFFGA